MPRTFLPCLAVLLVLRGPECTAADEPANPAGCETNTPLIRLTPACYEDENGFVGPRTTSVGGGPLPSARELSNLVCTQEIPEMPNRGGLAAMVFQWGQFLDHDITLVHTNPGEDFAIPVPEGDPVFTSSELPFHRSMGTGGVSEPRQQTNAIPALIDGSAVYGSDSSRTAALRSFTGGRLRTSGGPDGDLLPSTPSIPRWRTPTRIPCSRRSTSLWRATSAPTSRPG